MKLQIVCAMAVATLLGSASAECPNQCSGHGSCGNDDVCACYAMWDGGDCSQRKCPSRKAFADAKVTTGTTGRVQHYYTECSGRGVCDAESGECQCDVGFEGEGCERLSCPGGQNCNGHGVCELIGSANLNSAYTEWDAEKLTKCVCDPGYEGHDCMKRKCKLGNDPITRFTSANVAEADETQVVTFQHPTAFPATASFLLGYTDWRGETWKTRAITVADLTATSIKEALQTLPQRAIDSVTVTLGTDTTTDKTFTVTFDSSETPGDQPMLTLYTDGCTSNGCQPYYVGVDSVTNEGVTSTDGTGERAVCSNRGTCDSETGICNCFNGYDGHACENQRLVL